jgi:hypothetical protein
MREGREIQGRNGAILTITLRKIKEQLIDWFG